MLHRNSGEFNEDPSSVFLSLLGHSTYVVFSGLSQVIISCFVRSTQTSSSSAYLSREVL